MALIKCPDCGREFSDKAVSCPFCGCPINDARQVGGIYESNYAPPRTGMAIASMVLGIISLFTWLFFIGFLLAAIGLILGVISLLNNQSGKGMATAGVVTSSITLFFFFISLMSL